MAETDIKILACDDEISILESVKAVLISEGYQVITARNGKEAVELFKRYFPDLVILDVSMPGMTGFEVLDRIKPYFRDRYIPVIFMTVSVKINDKLKALHGGAVDYLTKPVSPEELLARIQNFLKIKKQHDILKKEATFDAMTGLLNKKHFINKAEEEIEKSYRNRTPLTFILIDIDNFKEINDSLGHLAGDRVIVDFAKKLKKSVRKIDLIGRFGGDEFMVMLIHKRRQEAEAVVRRLKKAMAKAINFEGNKINITFSMGIIEAPGITKVTIHELLKKADKALYNAKHTR